MDTSTITNIILGSYGALLTTYELLKTLRDKRRKLIFFHEFQIDKKDEKVSVPLIVLRVTNGGEKTIDLTEVGFSSSSGKIPLDKKLPFLARLGPGESHAFFYNLLKLKDVARTIKHYYAKDSFGKEFRYDLLTPILTQLNNSILREQLESFGFKFGASIEKAQHIAENVDKEARKNLDKIDVIINQTDQRLKQIKERQRKWQEYYIKTGERHPEQVEHKQKTLNDLRGDKNR